MLYRYAVAHFCVEITKYKDALVEVNIVAYCNDKEAKLIFQMLSCSWVTYS